MNVFNGSSGMLSSRLGYRLVAVSGFGLRGRPSVPSSVTGTMATMPFAGYGHPKPPSGLADRLAIGNFRLPPRRYTCDCDERPPSPPSPPPPPPPPPPEQQPVVDDDGSQNIIQRFKNTVKKYRYVVVPVHLVTSAAWFGSFYWFASRGIDVPGLLESFGFPGWIVDKVRDGNPWTSYTVIAFGLYKIVAPLRYMVTLAGVRTTARCLRKLGYVIDGSGKPKKSP